MCCVSYILVCEALHVPPRLATHTHVHVQKKWARGKGRGREKNKKERERGQRLLRDTLECDVTKVSLSHTPDAEGTRFYACF